MVVKKAGGTSDDNDVITIDMQPFLTPLSILLGSIIISVALLIGLRGVKTDGVDNTSSSGSVDSESDTDTIPTQEGFADATTTIDDDPYLGDKDKAKVAIVEFSDYECPFCKRHFLQTYSDIKKNYIDTGKAILVFRDFPLYFHDPLATQEAMAAECVQELGGNGKYFEYHDLVYNTTDSNGEGLEKSKLYDLAGEVGVDKGKFTECLDSERYKDEVQDDIADGQSAGVSGTPGFIIGRLKDDGTVEGKLISGAYPYESFKEVIEEYL